VKKLVQLLGPNTDMIDGNNESIGKWAKKVFRIQKVLKKLESKI
jgi:hypothetical protein